MISRSILITLALSAPVLASPLLDETVALEELVITADRQSVPIDQIASCVTVIDHEAIVASGASDLASLLAMNGTLDIKRNGGPGQVASLSLRGAKSGHTLLLIDGVEQNDPMSPGRSVNFGTFSLAFVDRVEIIYGPQSALYGADAIGGVVQVFTKAPDDFAYGVSLEAGGEGEFGGTLMFQDRRGKLGYRVEIAHRHLDGFSAANEALGNEEADGLEQSTMNLRFDMQATPALQLELGINGEYSDLDIDNFGGVAGDDPNSTVLTRRLGVWQKTTFSSAFGQSELKLVQQDTRRNTDNLVDADHPFDWLKASYLGSMQQLSFTHSLDVNPHHNVLFGFEWEQEKGESTLRSESAWGPWNSDFPEATAGTRSLFAQHRLTLSELFMTFGLRFDDHEQFGAARTGRFTLGLPIRELPLVLRASYGSGFKAPSLYQLHSAYANPELLPELSHGVDAGFDVRLSKLTVSVSFFNNAMKDQIEFYTDPLTWFSSYRNLKSTEARGVEAQLHLQLNSSLNLDAGFQHQTTEDLETGLQLIRHPRRQAHIGFSWQHMKSHLNLRWHYKGKRIDLGFDPITYASTRETLSSYSLIDLKIEQHFAHGISAFASMENLLDHEHEEILGYGVQGRILRVGFHLNP